MSHSSPLSRRELLARLSAAAATLGLSPDVRGWQQSGPTAPAAGRILDLHHHFGSPRWIKRVAESQRQGWQAFQEYTPARAIETMDEGGTQTAFLSCTEPGVWFGDDFERERQDAISLSRDMNEYGARLVSDYKGRFGLFAVLPLPDIDASLKETEYSLDTLKADGVGILTSYGNMWLGDARLRPVFDELNRRGAVVYTHPTDAPCCHNLANASPATLEWSTDTARSIMSLIAENPGARTGGGGVLGRGRTGGAAQLGSAAAPAAQPSAATRYTNIKFIWSHAVSPAELAGIERDNALAILPKYRAR